MASKARAKRHKGQTGLFFEVYHRNNHCAQVVLPQLHEKISVFKLLTLLLIHFANLSMMSNEVLHKQSLKRKRKSSSKTERKRPHLAEEKAPSSKTHNCEDTPCLDVKTSNTTKRVSLYINELRPFAEI